MKSLLLSPQTSRIYETIVTIKEGSFIWHGPSAVGKMTAAIELSRRLNCNGDTDKPCDFCIQHAQKAFADLIIIEPVDKPSIGIERVREVVQNLTLSPYYDASIRVVIFNEAQSLTVEAQNALLKLIEEPPPRTLIVLLVQEPQSLLETIRSRCMTLYFSRSSEEKIATFIEQEGGVKPVEAAIIAGVSEGLPGNAISLLNDKDSLSKREQEQKLAKNLIESNIFNRLMLAKEIIDSKTNMTLLAGNLRSYILTKMHFKIRP